MVNLDVVIVSLCFVVIALFICIAVYVIYTNTQAHEASENEKDRALTLKQAEMDFKLKAMELKCRQDLVAKPKDNKDPEKASESDLKAWFDIMTDPDKLFGDDTATKEVK